MDDRIDRLAEEAAEHFRTFLSGDILSDDSGCRVRYIVDGELGMLILPLRRDLVDANMLVLLVPEDEPDALQVLLDFETVDPEELPSCDRYLALHGEPEHPIWIRARLGDVKWRSEVLGGDRVPLGNPLIDDEPALCARANQDGFLLRTACQRARGVHLEAPLVVGVDPWGVTVRCRFGPIRVRFDRPARSADEAQHMIDHWLERPRR